MRRTDPTAAEYSVLLKNPSGDNLDEIESLLFYYLNRRSLVALCGAGCSKDELQYGDWRDLIRFSLKRLATDHQARLESYMNKPPGYISLRTILSFVENIEFKESRGERTGYRRGIQEYFRKTHNQNRKQKRIGRTYQKLIKLDIRRFVTTNFDLEIEMALADAHKIELSQLLPAQQPEVFKKLPFELAPFGSGKSFSQTDGCMDRLSTISLARNEVSDYMVFHCHGRFDDIDSCILTEGDYRSWYLKDTLPVRAFRQTMDLLFNSNPLLVIGYSLSDPELGQILRTVHAKRANDPRRSPLFLMLYLKGSKAKQRDQCLALNEEYGAYVIPVTAADGNIDQATHRKLDSLWDGWQEWREAIRARPTVRSFMPQPARRSKKYCHYLYSDLVQPVVPVVETAAYLELKEELTALVDDVNGARCAVLVAKSGSGKTWSMQRFAMDWLGDANHDETRRRLFFWSSYYSNDLYNGLKRAIKFFMDDPPSHVQFDQIMPLFKQILETKKDALLIFDGIEKLLKQSKHLGRHDRVEAGKAINRDVEEFLNVILDNRGAFVIVTSRSLPDRLAGAIGKGSVRLLKGQKENSELSLKRSISRRDKVYFADPINAGDYTPLRVVNSECNWEAFKSLTDEERMSLCSLLSGHIYSLCLVERILHFTPQEERKAWLRSFLGKMAETSTDRRRERVVREAIEAADRSRPDYKDNHDLLARFIERVALFMSPVESSALKTCLKLALEEQGSTFDNAASKLDEVIPVLRARALLLQIKFNNIPAPGYTVHSLVQSYVRRHLHRSAFSIHPSMILPGYTSDFDVVDPGSGKDRAKQLFSSLCDDAVEHARREKIRDAGASVRAAFGVLRSRFCSNTVSRWGNYHEYLAMVHRLRDVAILSTNKYWLEAETIDAKSNIYPDREEDVTTPPLYLTELAWLQNEAGLATYTEGNMLDAMFMRQQSSEINSLLDGKLPGFHRFQSYFNVGSVFIDLGELFHAKRYLDIALLIANAREDDGLRGRVLGYIGWLAYLQGNFEDAEKDLRLGLRLVRGNARAKSVLFTFLGQVWLRLRKHSEALDANERARALAEGAHYPDLVAYAQLGIANVLRSQNDHVRARREYETIFESAREYGLRRLEAGVLTGLSHWAYGLHDSEAACRYAIGALSISNEAALGLHQTECLLALGNALLLSNQDELGKAYLRTALGLAKEQGYFLRSTEAEAALHGVGEPQGASIDGR